MTTAALYIRKSKEDRSEKDSIANQEHQCHQEAERHDYEVVNVYIDDGVSGRFEIPNRPGLLKAYQAAQDGEYDVLVVRSLARFSRAYPWIAWNIFHKISEEVLIHTVKDGALPLSNPDKVSSAHDEIGESFREITRTTKRTSDGRYRSVARGNIVSGPDVKYGYKKVRDYEKQASHFEIVETEAIIVKQIYKDFLSDKTYSEIAEKLNDNGIQKHEGNEWSTAFIQRLITHPIYKGIWIYGEGKFDEDGNSKEQSIAVESIVSVKDWDNAQVKAVSVARKYAKNSPKHPYLLRGRMFCAECGCLYTSKTEKPRNRLYHYYKHQNNKDEPCPNDSLNLVRDTVENSVLTELEKLSKTTPMELIHRYKKETKNIKPKIDKLNKTIEKNDKKLNTARDKLIDGVMDDNDFSYIRDQVIQDNKILREEIENLKAKHQPKNSAYMDWLADYEADELAGMLEEQARNPDYELILKGSKFDELFEYMDRWNIRVEVVVQTDNDLKALLLLTSNYGSVGF